VVDQTIQRVVSIEAEQILLGEKHGMLRAFKVERLSICDDAKVVTWQN
jgi:hypothetical protein